MLSMSEAQSVSIPESRTESSSVSISATIGLDCWYERKRGPLGWFSGVSHPHEKQPIIDIYGPDWPIPHHKRKQKRAHEQAGKGDDIQTGQLALCWRCFESQKTPLYRKKKETRSPYRENEQRKTLVSIKIDRRRNEPQHNKQWQRRK